MFKIGWKERALKDLDKLDPSISRRIVKSVDEMKENLFAKDIKKLKGSDDFRLRVGDYRVIFSIEGDPITILKVGHRHHIYEH